MHPLDEMPLDKQLEEIADGAYWYLSDWMEEAKLRDAVSVLLSIELRSAWKKLVSAKNDWDDFYSFFINACDSLYKYSQISKPSIREQKSDLLKMENEVGKLIKLLQKDSFLSMDLGRKLNEQLFNQLEKIYTVSLIKNDGYSMGRPRDYFPFQAKEWLGALKEIIRQTYHNPVHHHLLSAKRGNSGLIAFYTNSLSVVTNEKFKRPCYEEIADIANAVLDTDKDAPITAENVRMNYNNLIVRLKNKN